MLLEDQEADVVEALPPGRPGAADPARGPQGPRRVSTCSTRRWSRTTEAIQALNPGDPGFAGRDEADATWLVNFTDDVGPAQYFAYDRASRTGTFLFTTRPELTDYELARMEPFSFAARDGLTVHGYVTFPPGGGRTGLPAVLNVHGGPQARDTWGFDPEAQWLANRGYLCIQVNYRGSTGYGDKAFVSAGDREWGSKMPRRPARRGGVRRRSGLGRSGQGGHLRRLLRRLRGARRRGLHAGRLPLRGRRRRPVEPPTQRSSRSRPTGRR